MGCRWNFECANKGRGEQPKLTVAGRMEGSVFGRPVTIDASGKKISLQLPSLVVAWKLRRFVAELVRPTSAISKLHAHALTVKVKVAAWPAIEVFPNPSLGLRFLVPPLKRLRPPTI